MGITIHYSGRAKSREAIRELMKAAQLFAAERDWMMAMYEDPLGIYEDVDPDDPGYIEEHGPYMGVVLRPHRHSEPVRLQFNLAREFSGFTKTRYAPFEVHREIVALLRLVAPHLESFEVNDESGFWDDGDEDAARPKFATAEEIATSDDVPDQPEWGGVPDFADDDDDSGPAGTSPGHGPYG
jgi:hypothetical protein